MIGLLFWLLTLLACGYAATFGGKDGKFAGALIVAASILTIPGEHSGLVWGAFELGVFLVDSALLAGFYVLTLKSRRWWPIWMTGFHFLAVTSHLGVLLASDFVAPIYFAAASFSAVTVPISMVAGIALDRRAAMRSLSKVADDETALRR